MKAARRRGFTLIELLVVLAIIAILAGVFGAALPTMLQRGDRADALAKIRQMGTAVLHYPADHGGKLPSLFPGQVLEYDENIRGRIVTVCADYLGISSRGGTFLVDSLMPRAYGRLKEPADHNTMRVYVMNTEPVTTDGRTVYPFGQVVDEGVAPEGSSPLAVVADVPVETRWMMSTADREQPQVAAAPWSGNTPAEPPLGSQRAVFDFDGSARLVDVDEPEPDPEP